MESNENLCCLEFLHIHKNAPAPITNQKWEKIEQQFKGLRRLSTLINNTFGSFITIFLLEFLFYYSNSMDKIFAYSKLDWKELVLLVYWFFHGVMILYFAAEACLQVKAQEVMECVYA